MSERGFLKKGRVPGLDALRGVAIGLVLLRHAWPEIFDGAGLVGVVIFFCLSGYLITGLLLNDLENLGHIRWARFYRHRAFRLIPALLLLLLFLALVTAVFDPFHDRSELSRSLLVALTYTANVPGFDKGSASLAHLWTLALEEQFYLVWPILLAYAVKRGWTGLLVAGSLAGLGSITCVGLWLAWPDVERVYTSGIPWAAAMVLGALVAILEQKRGAHFGAPGSGSVVLASLALGGLAIVPDLKSHYVVYLLGAPIVSAATLLLIAFVRIKWNENFAPLRWLAGLGRVSYAVYLWNLPVVLLMSSISGSRLIPIFGIFASIGVGILSTRYVERPILKRRDTFFVERRNEYR